MAWLGGVTPAGATGHGSLPAALQCPHSHWPSARVHKPLYEHELGRGVTGKEGQGWLRHLPAALAAARPLESDLVAAGWGEDGLVCAHVYLLRKVSWVEAGPGHPGQAGSLEALRAPLARGVSCPQGPILLPDSPPVPLSPSTSLSPASHSSFWIF